MDFLSALDTKVDDIEKPLDPPQGTYLWKVDKAPIQSRTKSDEWDIVEFPLRALSADEDVDPDDLEAFGDVTGIMGRNSFMFPTDPAKDNDRKKTLHQMKKFLTETLRIDGEGMTMKELLAASVGAQCYGILSWRQVDEEVYVDVKRFTPAD